MGAAPPAGVVDTWGPDGSAGAAAISPAEIGSPEAGAAAGPVTWVGAGSAPAAALS